MDIIARKGDTCAFIEVKTRLTDTFGAPSEAVQNSRKLKYIRGANYYFMNAPTIFILSSVIMVSTGVAPKASQKSFAVALDALSSDLTFVISTQ